MLQVLINSILKERERIEQQKPPRSRYLNGYKYCKICRQYYYTDSLTCPSCGSGRRLRVKPAKAGKYRPAWLEYPRVDPEKYGVRVD